MCFYKNLEKFSENIAIIQEDYSETTYKELLNEVNKIEAELETRSLAFCVCDNLIESIIFYIACLRKKVVPVLINKEISKDLLKRLLELYRPKYIWAERNEEVVEGLIETISYKNYGMYLTNYNIDYKINEDTALLLTTSGSTGSPKLVRLSYKNINSNAEAIVKYLNITNNDRAITTLPMSYTYGLSIINSHLLAGASIIITKKTLMSKEFWGLLKDKEATNFGGVPYIYEMLKKLRFERMNIPSIRYITQAGGKLSKELSLEFAEICYKKDIEFIVMYGQTEATARMAYLPSEYSIKKVGSMGIAIPGGEFLLEDEDGKVITDDNVSGELIYKGENVSLGYAEDRFDLIKEDENNGILRTGDMAKKDKDGFYYIVGRKKRFLKLFGSRINLDEVEQLLNNRGYESICSGTDDNLKIYITSSKNQEDIKKYLIEEIGISNQGFEIIQIENIPRNEAGKVLYSKL